ncbi:MAG: hypothetical protein L0229_13435 [Blastocatellia bacterium]|nr:hypothetical protein [Blastocatellia bacterium]
MPLGALAPTGKAEVRSDERAVVEFTQTVKLLDVFLTGRYLVLHDDARMAEGEACLYVYRQSPGEPDQLVVSFHCRPVQRARADRFKILASPVSPSISVLEVREIQFAGATKAHQIP